jgi:hypothetical protein
VKNSSSHPSLREGLPEHKKGNPVNATQWLAHNRTIFRGLWGRRHEKPFLYETLRDYLYGIRACHAAIREGL